MKLIIKQYLSSLKERGELDAILPDLLSQMGLVVYARPIRGANEYGVDIGAVGKIGDDVEKVYLFSVKSGNLTRSTWNGSADQALRPSLESIIDSYIPHRLPPEHRNKPIVICMCFGGDIQTTARQDVSGFTSKYQTDTLSFEEWNGDKLSDLILEYLLKEELLPQNWQSMLRRALALVDEPEFSHTHFKKLINEMVKVTESEVGEIVNLLNRINLCLWILFSWCRDSDNLESSYLAAEFSLLRSWDTIKKYDNVKLYKAYDELIKTYHVITKEFIDKCLIPFTDKKHAISRAISSQCSIDINLKLFDLLGRLAIRGQWLSYELTSFYKQEPQGERDTDKQNAIRNELDRVTNAIMKFISNNPLLSSPCKDEHAIELGLVLHLLSQNSENDIFINEWLNELINRIIFGYKSNNPGNYMYPCNLDSYEQLLEHKNREDPDDEYQKKITHGSILYPILMVFSVLHKIESMSADIQEFSRESLKHCTLQYWFPTESSELYFYNNKKMHGAALPDFNMDPKKVIRCMHDECGSSNFFDQLSAIQKEYAPLIMLACRYYRYPVPLHFLLPLMEDYLCEENEIAC